MSAAPKSPDSGGAASGSGGRSGATAAAGALGMCRSVAPPATRHMSGPMIDNNWDFDRANDKPVRVLLQVGMTYCHLLLIHFPVLFLAG